MLRASGFAVVAGLLGCQVLIDTQVSQCDVDDDCTARGIAFAGTRCVAHDCTAPAGDAGSDAPTLDPRWACVGNVKFPELSSSQKVAIRERVVRVLVFTPVKDVLMEACGKYDTVVVPPTAASYCAQPLTSGTSDAEGYTSLDVPLGFDGYLATHPSPALPSIVPTLYFRFPPPSASDPPTIRPELGLLVLTNEEFSALVSLVSPNPIDPQRGHVFLGTYDCQGAAAAGVSFRISAADSATVRFYDTTGIPSVTAEATSANGRGGFVNVPPGAVTVEAFLTPSNTRFASYTVIVRPGFITYLRVVPTPL